MAENKNPTTGLNDQERFPLLEELSFLKELRQDEFAPAFNFQSGDRLEEAHLEQVNAYARRIMGGNTFWAPGETPDWLADYLSWCKATVPFYKNREDAFEEQPTIGRKEVAALPWRFVSEESDLDDLLVYQTSGSTGPAMDVLFDPVSQACWIPQLQSILENHQIELNAGPDQVAIALICSQSSTLTYASLSTYLKGAGILKLNLNPKDWKDPAHRTKFLEKHNPQVLTGDPFAFLDLLELKPAIRPKAMISSAMKLTDGVREKLEAYFCCPVLDIYSMTECRMIAYADGNRHKAIRPELYLEIFDKEEDVLLPYGERGELVITGGINPFLPLIRYRTGDFCSLEIEDGIPYLVGLEARAPVHFYTRNGKVINNIEVSREMSQFALAGFTLHQDENYDLVFTGWSDEGIATDLKNTLHHIFNDDISLEVIIQPVRSMKKNKLVTYSSAVEMPGM